ncbi:PAS domain-containing hybrid sensor histidine kinase/response regulator [Hyalangium gracile]|uniref:PAS domain-containing hybrid sensor histidine kinase/response regulator n=1 Tax=Hyalangium gracile TaxID=394092 RepID=UPI001CCA6192|nr:PAS domain-containing hybrid sensor histidine kinase/response regulator [Hyalangium gracile]
MIALTRTNVREESAEELYEHAPCGHLSTLPDGTIIKVNETFLEWTGYTREELLGGMRFLELLTIAGKIFHETHYAPLLRMQGFVREIQLDLVCKQGRALPSLVNSVQKKDAEGRVLLHRTTLFSITDRKNYERELLLARRKAEQAEQAARSKTAFLSMVSHEIRTPMNAIVGLAGLLRQSTLSAEQQKYVSILQASSENLLGLLNNILDLSKIEAGKVALEERPFDVRQLLHGIFYGLTVKAEEKKLNVLVEVDEQVPAWLLGDPVKLSQVLTNLLANAIKFTERGTVTLAARVQESSSQSVSIEFRVTDTGIGIPKHQQAEIFEEFTQASYDIHQQYGGTGLGLTICRQLLGLHGSTLSLESAPGEGSSFFFTLGLKRAQASGAQEAATKDTACPRDLQGVRLLVAEDNTVNVFVLSQYLRRWGASFEVVENGHAAVAHVQEARFDAVLMDLQMPELDGYEATRAIRALPEESFKRLPILAMTASSRAGLEDRLADAGFTDFVCKPFRPEELLSRIALHARQSPTVLADAAPEEEPGRSQELPAPPAPTPPRFSLDGFRRMAEGDPEALTEFITITITNAEQHGHAFQKALATGNLEEFAFQAHKIKMTVALLQAHVLEEALQRGRALLTREERAPAELQAAAHAIQAELDAIIVALKEDLLQSGRIPPLARD